MKLFKLNTLTFEVEYEELALLLAPFAALFKRDKTAHKDIATKELAYVWFFSDIRSDYQCILEPEVRTIELIKDLKLPQNWKPDKLVLAAVEFYKERSKSISVTLLEDSYGAINKVSTYLREMDLNETEKDFRGNLKQKYDISKIVSAIKAIPQLIAALKEAENAYLREKQSTEGKTHGSRTENIFENGL